VAKNDDVTQYGGADITILANPYGLCQHNHTPLQFKNYDKHPFAAGLNWSCNYMGVQILT